MRRRVRRRWWRSYRRMRPLHQSVLGLSALLVVSLAVNWLYQVVRKPSELFFPVSGTLYKTPPETWRQYSFIFNRYSTNLISPALLAAIAQVEGSGNPVARTYWRWTWTRQPFKIYRPASSAVGMYQMTDATFAQARRWCIKDHAVMEQGAWDDWGSCWFNRFYARVLPADAAELTSAYLDRQVAHILERNHGRPASWRQKQDLAAVIHLCGAGAGEEFARRGFRLSPEQRCGDHEARAYLERVNDARLEFERLAQRSV